MSSEHKNSPDIETTRKASAFSDEPLVPDDAILNWDQELVEAIPESQALDTVSQLAENDSSEAVTNDSQFAPKKVVDPSADSQEIPSETTTPRPVDEAETAESPIDQPPAEINAVGLEAVDDTLESETTQQDDFETTDNVVSKEGNESNL